MSDFPVTLADLFQADPALQGYLTNPAFGGLDMAYQRQFPVARWIEPALQPVVVELALRTLRHQDSLDPQARDLATHVLAEKFGEKFVPREATAPTEGSSGVWFDRPQDNQAWAAVLKPQRPSFSLPAEDKISFNAAVTLYLGLEPSPADNFHNVPLGSLGRRIIGLRYLVLNGKEWFNRHGTWGIKRRIEQGIREEGRKNGWDSGRIEREIAEKTDEVVRFIAHLGVLKWKLSAISNDDFHADFNEEVFDALKAKAAGPADQVIDDKLLQFLTAQHLFPMLEKQNRVWLHEQSVSLWQTNKAALDLLYLATCDITKYPATTVTAGELKYVIVPIKSEMGVRAIQETLVAGKIPVVVYSKMDDSNSWPKRLAEKNGAITVAIEGNSNIYADFEKVAQAIEGEFVKRFGAEKAKEELASAAIYPGYGAFAESADAIRYFRRHGIVFIGPMEDVVRHAGSKAAFRKIAQTIDPASVTPGVTIDSNDPKIIESEVKNALDRGDVVLPGRVKAENGGGGRGQVVVKKINELKDAIETVQAEIGAKRWVPGIMFEQNIENTIHLEVQILRDRYGHTVHFGMRDCSEQRSMQKIQEEAPPALLKRKPNLKRHAQTLAVLIADFLGYVGAGTVELMFKEDSGEVVFRLGEREIAYREGKFYSLEMNTRIQVEHPVSEVVHEIIGPDGSEPEEVNLPQWQFRIAEGEPIDFTQDQVVENGYVARQFRINAEVWDPEGINEKDGEKGTFDPYRKVDFEKIEVPLGDAAEAEILRELEAKGISGIENLLIRFDSGFEGGDQMVNQDPNFAKLIIAVKPRASFEGQEYELLRQAAMAVLNRVNITGTGLRFVDKKGFFEPLRTNIPVHLRLLESRQMKLHARGIDEGRDVNWVMRVFRGGENLDDGPYPALMRRSEEQLPIPVGYAIQLDDPELTDVSVPVVFSRPEKYNGLLAVWLDSLKGKGKRPNFNRIFGLEKIDKESHRIRATLDTEERLINTVLFDKNKHDLPVSMLVSLEVMGLPQLLRVNLSKNESVRLQVTNITPGGAGESTEFKLEPDGKGELRKRVEIPGVPGEFEFVFVRQNGSYLFLIKNEQGDQIIRVRPHMAKDYVDKYFEHLGDLADKTLSKPQAKSIRDQLQQTFEDMAVVSGEKTATRAAFVKGLARSPHRMTTELVLMTRYEHRDAEVERRVRDLAYEVLAYRYYDTNFHDVRGFSSGNYGPHHHRVHTAVFDDADDAMVVNRAKDRRVVWVAMNEPSKQDPALAVQAIGGAVNAAFWGLGGNNAGPNDVIEVLVRQHLPDADEFARSLQDIVNKKLGDKAIRRVTFIVYAKEGDPDFKPASGIYTFRPSGTPGEFYRESISRHDPNFAVVPRDEHPMVSEQMERWRWRNFESRSVNYSSKNERAHITEVTAKGEEFKDDRRYILDNQIREPVAPMEIDGELVRRYLSAVLFDMDAGAVFSELMMAGPPEYPPDLRERLDNFIRWRLFKRGFITDPFNVDWKKLKEQINLTTSRAAEIGNALNGMWYYSEPIDEAIKLQAAELQRLMKDAPLAHNRIDIFIQPPVSLSEDFIGFLGFHYHSKLKELGLERVSVHFNVEVKKGVLRPRVITLEGNPRDVRFSSIMDASMDESAIVRPKTGYDMAVRQLHAKGNYAPAEKAAMIFDDGKFQELRFKENGNLEEKEFDPNHRQTVRGFVGLVGGRKTYIIAVDPLSARRGLSFDKPDGEFIKAFIDRTFTERDEKGNIVNAPIIKIEELSAGANLYKKGDPSWAATDPLDQFAREFEARYRHAALSRRPNITVIDTLVVGGGIYGPKASHDVVVGKGLAVAALTGGNAAAYATGAKPRLNDAGKLVPIGGSANFDERSSGSTDVHAANGVFHTVVTTGEIESLIAQGVPIEEVERRLSPEAKIELIQATLKAARESVLFLDNNLESLLPEKPDIDLDRPIDSFRAWLNDPIFAAIANNDAKTIKKLMKERNGRPIPSFIPVLEDMAVRGRYDRPLVKVWGEKWAPDILTAWVALRIEQDDGSRKVESVAFVMNDPSGPKRGAITPEACQKVEEFLEINSSLGLSMFWLVGTPGFLANAMAEKVGIEEAGKRAMRQKILYGRIRAALSHYLQRLMAQKNHRAAIYSLEFAEDDGGGQIFNGEPRLWAFGQFVADAVDHPLVRLAPLPIRATAGVIGAGRMREIEDDAKRDAFFEAFAQETIPSGSPARAQQNSAIRNLIEPENILMNISSGIAQARRQAKFFGEIYEPLMGFGILLRPESDAKRFDPSARFWIEDRSYSYEEVRALITRLEEFERLVGLAGKGDVFQVTKDARVLIDGVEYDDPASFFAVAGLEEMFAPHGEVIDLATARAEAEARAREAKGADGGSAPDNGPDNGDGTPDTNPDPRTPSPEIRDTNPDSKDPKGMAFEHPQARANRIMDEVRQGSVELEDDGSLALARKQKRDVGAQFIAPEAANNNDYYVDREEADAVETTDGEVVEEDEASSGILTPQPGSLMGAGLGSGVFGALATQGRAPAGTVLQFAKITGR